MNALSSSRLSSFPELRYSSRPSFGAHLVTLAGHCRAVLQRRRQLARDAAELGRMDDRLLRDIGLTRFEVERFRYRALRRHEG